MKRILIPSMVAAVWLLAAGCTSTPPKPAGPVKQTYSAFDLPSDHPRDKAANGRIDFDNVPLETVLRTYGQISGRVVVHGPLPAASITLHSQKPLGRVETLRLLDTALAQNGIAMVLSGDQAVKAVPPDEALAAGPPEITLPWQLLPDSDSCMSRTVEVRNFRPTEAVAVLVPLSKLPHSIMAIDHEHVLVLRDYSANIRQELRLLEELEKKQAQ
jgi:type II secretory pathway component GspD/PulD (secretin)